MKDQGLASSLHGQFPIKIRQNNPLTAISHYPCSCSTLPYALISFSEGKFIRPSFHFSMFFSMCIWWFFISAYQGLVILRILYCYFYNLVSVCSWDMSMPPQVQILYPGHCHNKGLKFEHPYQDLLPSYRLLFSAVVAQIKTPAWIKG